MEEPFIQLKIYYTFKEKLKNDKLVSCKNYPSYNVFIISKEDILKWKQFYEYNKSLFSNSSLIIDWESKIRIKIQNQEKPTFKILSTFNEIKNNLTKGICIINKEFIIASNYKMKNKLPKEIKCYVGNKRFVLEFNDFS